MTLMISGVAILAICTLLGALLGDLLGMAIGVKANVGGVGIAMILLISARLWLLRRRLLTDAVTLDVKFWAALYVPVVVAMAAQQNVVAAFVGGPIVLIAAIGGLTLCFGAVALINRLSGSTETMDEIEAREGQLLGASSDSKGKRA
ncbi:MAG: malonate carrier protein [Gammaproteobacteria bacterium]|jgi:malonate transporter MadL subunit|nr:malonate carrier protein [Gammaproteobacteria bacterium]